MMLFTQEQRTKMLANGAKSAASADGSFDAAPVVKLFTPDGGATWLLSELDPDRPDIAFGLCDMGTGFPELGSVSISELESVRGKMGLPVEREQYTTFPADVPMSRYADEARKAGGITLDFLRG
ncbi:hypothetical protein BAJUN_00570 [Bajunvirus bajun]|uniref:Uncharacterized protein n=1 Tax=Brevundimonas phage vB_BgoS-Bajun TaxID=2948594 RepID=A0A9E7N6W9_9CAUD|nr:hypothetical protein BAJUN_00570 [Brevundimonas phage vB_BgoS-Bajun]